MSIRIEKTLVEAIYERYNEMIDENSLTPSSPECEASSSFDSSSLCSFYITAQSPRKTRMYFLYRHAPFFFLINILYR